MQAYIALLAIVLLAVTACLGAPREDSSDRVRD